MRISLGGLVLGLILAGSALAQQVISAHSGVVQYVEGAAYINDNQVDPKFGQFPDIRENQVFRTEEGRAEVLLTPGVFLRLSENSSVRMVSNKLTDTRVEILSGSVMVECEDIPKDNAITLLYKNNSMSLVKRGLYRVDSEPARAAVYDGEAILKSESGQLTLKAGKQTGLNGALMAENFDKKDGDELYRWSARRSGYLSKANVSSAMGLRNSGTYTGGWYLNPMFGMYTFIPYRGMFYSPFGFGFFSPYTVGYYGYYPGYYNNYYGYGASGGVSSSRTPAASAFNNSNLGYTGGSRGFNPGSSNNSGGFSSPGGAASGSGGRGGFTGGGPSIGVGGSGSARGSGSPGGGRGR